MCEIHRTPIRNMAKILLKRMHIAYCNMIKGHRRKIVNVQRKKLLVTVLIIEVHQHYIDERKMKRSK